MWNVVHTQHRDLQTDSTLCRIQNYVVKYRIKYLQCALEHCLGLPWHAYVIIIIGVFRPTQLNLGYLQTGTLTLFQGIVGGQVILFQAPCRDLNSGPWTQETDALSTAPVHPHLVPLLCTCDTRSERYRHLPSVGAASLHV